jgi:COP9 signalosome complex subunit 3
MIVQIESGDISARISADGTVTFSDPPPQFTKADVDAMLAGVQAQTGMLSELDREIGRSREFLGKVRFWLWMPLLLGELIGGLVGCEKSR